MICCRKSTTNATNSLNNIQLPFLRSGLRRPFQPEQHQSNRRCQGMIDLLPAKRCFLTFARCPLPGECVFGDCHSRSPCTYRQARLPLSGHETACPPLNLVGPPWLHTYAAFAHDHPRACELSPHVGACLKSPRGKPRPLLWHFKVLKRQFKVPTGHLKSSRGKFKVLTRHLKQSLIHI